VTALAVIPARGGSKGLQHKNLLPLVGVPLVGHAIRLAELCPELTEVIVTTEDEEIGVASAALGAAVLRRPANLARDDTPMWPVLRHALDELDPRGDRFDILVLLEPTNPLRLPEDVAGTLAALRGRPDADGALTVSEPRFSIVWQSVVITGGLLEQLVPAGKKFERRQDVPPAAYVNGCVYAWRTEFVRRERERWLNGRTVPYTTPELRAISIDTAEDFELCELLVESGCVSLPWLGASTSDL